MVTVRVRISDASVPFTSAAFLLFHQIASHRVPNESVTCLLSRAEEKTNDRAVEKDIQSNNRREQSNS